MCVWHGRGSSPDLWPDATWGRSQFTSQGKDRVEADRAADGHCASGESYDHGDRENHWEQHGRNLDLRIEDGVANLMGQRRSDYKTDRAANQGHQRGFS